jgi:hypothetical protein
LLAIGGFAMSQRLGRDGLSRWNILHQRLTDAETKDLTADVVGVLAGRNALEAAKQIDTTIRASNIRRLANVCRFGLNRP